jgi:hypothetical protein
MDSIILLVDEQSLVSKLINEFHLAIQVLQDYAWNFLKAKLFQGWKQKLEILEWAAGQHFWIHVSHYFLFRHNLRKFAEIVILVIDIIDQEELGPVLEQAEHRLVGDQTVNLFEGQVVAHLLVARVDCQI